jgi:hypothetical protein
MLPVQPLATASQHPTRKIDTARERGIGGRGKRGGSTRRKRTGDEKGDGGEKRGM